MITSKTIIPIYNLSCERDELNYDMLNIKIIVKNDKELMAFCHDNLDYNDDTGYQNYEINELIHIIQNVSECFKASKVCITFSGIEPLIYADVIKQLIDLTKQYRWMINIITPLICEIEDLCLVLDKINNWYIVPTFLDKKDLHNNLYFNNARTNLSILSDCIDKSKLNITANNNKLYSFA